MLTRIAIAIQCLLFFSGCALQVGHVSKIKGLTTEFNLLSVEVQNPVRR